MSNTDSESTRPPWASTYFLILPDGGGKRILMLPSAEGWRLPQIRTEKTWLSEAGNISAAVCSAYELPFDFTVLRYVAIEINEQERWDRLLLVLEPRQPLQQPPLDGQWLDRAQLQELNLALPDQRQPLLRYLEENEEGPDSPLIDPRRSPWARPGWFAAASAWIEEAIGECGYTQSGPVQQLRNWSISCLLYVPTSAGKLYFKAAAALPFFVNEPALTQTLSDLFPGQIPIPLKIDRQRRWLLMHDFEQGEWDAPIAISPIVRAYGLLQRTSAEHIDELLAASCVDRRLSHLALQIDPLIADPDTRAALKAEEFTLLVAMGAELKRRCAKAAEYKVPATILHGDLHFGNMTQPQGRQGENKYLFFDWTDACIGFPFLDLFLLYVADEDIIDQTGGRDAYLEIWRDFESPERLLELWELAKPLCSLHHSISYLSIIQSIEPLTRHELYHGFPDNLRALIAAMTPLKGISQ